jgi:membrane protein
VVKGRPAVDGFPRRLGRWLWLTLRESHEDSIFLTASALAFVTILSLIPLLATFSFVGTRVFHQAPERTLEVFVQILPYSEETVVDKIGEFLDQAETIHGFGLIVFFATAVFAFATVEETINKIWNVSLRRPFRVRLLSFVLLLFWGPLLIGATFTSLLVLRQRPELRALFEESALLAMVPLAVTALGLTMLYWLVPYTTVKFRNALVGGLLAAILLELLRQGFAQYVEVFRTVNVVYGSFAFALLFVISIEVTWTMILFGSEAAYTAQHFRILSRGLHKNPPVQAAWVGLAALTLTAGRFARGEPVLSRLALADRLALSAPELDRILRPLLEDGLLRRMDGGYILATDPHHLNVERVLAAYDHRARRGVELVGGPLAERLEALVAELAESRAGRLGELAVADLLKPREPPAPPSDRPAAPAARIPQGTNL